MSGVESLRVIGRIVDHSHRGDMIDNLPGVSVVKVVTAIVATVTIKHNQYILKAANIITQLSHP